MQPCSDMMAESIQWGILGGGDGCGVKGGPEFQTVMENIDRFTRNIERR